MNTPEILAECHNRGVLLVPHGRNIMAYAPPGALDARLSRAIKRHKPGILAFLRESRHAALQVLAGEFVGAKRRTRLAVARMLLLNILDPLCRRALADIKARHASKRH